MDDGPARAERVRGGARRGGDDEAVGDRLGEVLAVDEGVDGVEVRAAPTVEGDFVHHLPACVVSVASVSFETSR